MRSVVVGTSGNFDKHATGQEDLVAFSSSNSIEIEQAH
jgi:hypothetical protein